MSRLCGWGFFVVTLLGLLVLAGVAFGVSPFSQLALPAQASSGAAAVDQQLIILMVVSGSLLMIALVASVRATTRGHRPPSSDSTGEGVDARRSFLWWLPMLSGIALLAVAECSGWLCHVPSVASVPESADGESSTAYATLRLRTYECRVTYAGADGRCGTPDDLHVAGELRVPLDQYVTIHLTADDGPHRWYVPSLRRSIDVRKGKRLAVDIRATATGVFDMIVVDLSGCREDAVPATMVAESASDVQQWLNSLMQRQQSEQAPLPEIQP